MGIGNHQTGSCRKSKKINAKVLAGLDARGPMPEYADAFTYASLANEARIGRYESPRYTREELDIIQNNLGSGFIPKCKLA